jgi:hypothetical protein
MKEQGMSAQQKEILKGILPKMTKSVFSKVDRCTDIHNKRQKIVTPPSPQMEPLDPSLPEEVEKLEKAVDDLEEAVEQCSDWHFLVNKKIQFSGPHFRPNPSMDSMDSTELPSGALWRRRSAQPPQVR